MDEKEIEKKIEDLGADINKSIKGLEQGAKDGTQALDKLKELQAQLDAVKDNPDKIKGLSEKVEEVILKLNRPDFGKTLDKGFKEELAEGLTKALSGKNFGSKGETASFKMEKAQEGLTKAASLITSGNLTDANGTASANPEYRQSVLLGPNRKVHMRSILTQSPMSGDLIRYPQHVASDGDFAIQVNQGDVKATIDEKFELVNAVAHTIAGIYHVSKQSLADIPWLAQALISKGTERYMKKEDYMMLYGVGGDNEIKGIKEYAPVFTGDMPNLYEAILNGVYDLLDKDYDPTGTLLRPLTYAELLKYKTSTGEYNMPMLFMPNQQFPMSVAGVPIMMSTGVQANDVFIGDWGPENIRMLIREGLNVEFSYENKDNFERNLVSIRMESRIGLEVDEPLAFRYLDVSGIAPAI